MTLLTDDWLVASSFDPRTWPQEFTDVTLVTATTSHCTLHHATWSVGFLGVASSLYCTISALTTVCCCCSCSCLEEPDPEQLGRHLLDAEPHSLARLGGHGVG